MYRTGRAKTKHSTFAQLPLKTNAQLLRDVMLTLSVVSASARRHLHGEGPEPPAVSVFDVSQHLEAAH